MKTNLQKTILPFLIMLLMAMAPGLDALSKELDGLEKADPKRAVSKDIEMTRSFIQKAKNSEGTAKKRFQKRSELGMELVRALVSATQISDAADAQESAAYSTPETLKKLKEKVDALSKRRDELKKMIKQLEKK